jgi:hypothetical protein
MILPIVWAYIRSHDASLLEAGMLCLGIGIIGSLWCYSHLIEASDDELRYSSWLVREAVPMALIRKVYLVVREGKQGGRVLKLVAENMKRGSERLAVEVPVSFFDNRDLRKLLEYLKARTVDCDIEFPKSFSLLHALMHLRR